MTIVGRDVVLRRLADAAWEAKAGRGGLVVVRAYPGDGMSAVLDAHAEQTRAAGLPTFRVVPVPPGGRTALSGGVPDSFGAGVVVVDRVDLVDDATVLALHELLDDGRALSLVCGRRRGPAGPRFARTGELVVDLAPLDGASVRWLAARVPSGRRRLVRGAAGSPRLLALLAETDHVRAVADWVSDVAGGDIGMLRFATLLDRPSVDELAAVSRLAPVEAVAAVDRLCALGLVAEHGGAVVVRHDVVRDAVAEVSSGLRGSVARALAESGAPAERVVPPLAGPPVTAWGVDWLCRHADGLTGRPTTELADALRAAVDHLRPGDARGARLRTALAEALLGTGELDAAQRTAQTCLAAEPDPPLRHRLRAVLAKAHIARMDAAGALAAIDPEREHGPLPGRLAVLDAYARLLAGDLDGTVRAVEELAPSAGSDPLVEVSLLHIQAAGLALGRDLPGAQALLDRAAALLAVAVADPAQWVLSRLLRAVVQDLRHDAAALVTAEEARTLVHQLGAGWLAWWRTVVALAAYNSGRWELALAEVDAALGGGGDQYGMARPLHGIAAHILAHRGDLDAARGHVARAERSEASGVAAFYEQVLLSAHAMIADLAGDSERALAIARVIAGGTVGVHPGNAVAGAGPHLVRIAVGSGDRELADRLLAQMRQWTTDESTGQEANLWYCQGLVDGDVELLLAAARRFAADGSPIAAGRAAEDAAVLLAATGQSADARAAYGSAVDRYSSLAATTDIARAGAALRAHGVRPGSTGTRRRPKQGWDSLTAAERRVADLVAGGKTNREIAAHLVISVRTVDSHVSRILTKLGYSSRVSVIRDHRAPD